MKVFVTGVNGQLGYAVMNELFYRGHLGFGSGRTRSYSGIKTAAPILNMPYSQLDITDKRQVTRVIKSINPDAVIHCAAWTNVDGAENNFNTCHNINVEGTKNLALVCKEVGAKLLYISSDYVFCGKDSTPWPPDCREFSPLNTYGQSKLDGEYMVSRILDNFFIVRTSWVYGPNGKNFINTMLTVGKTHDFIRVVNDQIGRPTYAYDLSRLIVDMIETEKYGYYHATNEGNYISWYDFACEIFKLANYHTIITPVTTAEYGFTKAARPLNSRLDTSKLINNGFVPLPDWHNALSRYLSTDHFSSDAF